MSERAPVRAVLLVVLYYPLLGRSRRTTVAGRDTPRPRPVGAIGRERARVCALCALCVRETVRGAVRAVGTRLSCVRVCRGCAV